jgi:hypothetical protein
MMLYILIGYMLLFIHRPFEIWPALGEMHVERVYILGAAAFWLIAPGKRIAPTRLDLGILGFCTAVLFAWVSSPWSDGGQPAVEDWFKIVFFYFLVTTAVNRPEDLRKLMLAFLLIMAFYMFHSLWEFRNGRHTYRMGIARMVGVDKTLGDPNSFGASIVYALPFIRLFWLTAQSRLLKLFLTGYLGLSGLCILLTGSRSSLLGLITWGLITCLQSGRRIRLLALAGLLAVVAFAALPESLQTRFETMINPDVGPENAKVSGQGRIDGLINGWALLQKYPLTGCGPGVWRKATGSEIESHSLYGQLMGETGFVGVVAFGTLVVGFALAIRNFRRRCREFEDGDGRFMFNLTTALATALVLLLLEGLFGHNLLRFTWLWYIGFLVIATRAIHRVPASAPMWYMPARLENGLGSARTDQPKPRRAGVGRVGGQRLPPPLSAAQTNAVRPA